MRNLAQWIEAPRRSEAGSANAHNARRPHTIAIAGPSYPSMVPALKQAIFLLRLEERLRYAANAQRHAELRQ